MIRTSGKVGEFVFVQGGGKPYTSTTSRANISSTAGRTMLAAGIKDASFHTLRHTFAAWFRQDDGSLEDLRDELGHSSITQTERYAHHGPERRAAVAERQARIRVKMVAAAENLGTHAVTVN